MSPGNAERRPGEGAANTTLVQLDTQDSTALRGEPYEDEIDPADFAAVIAEHEAAPKPARAKPAWLADAEAKAAAQAAELLAPYVIPREPSGWEPINLAKYANGSHESEQATVLLRSDGVGLLYPGLVHAFNGEPESGKSMLAQYAVAAELKANNYVLVLDYESDPAPYVARLLAMGVTVHELINLDYIKPESDPGISSVATSALGELLADHAYTLAIIDGVTEALSIGGRETNSNDDVTKWFRMLPRRIAAAGAAVVVIDHVTKSSDGRGRFAIGAQAKLAAIDGAVFLIDVHKQLGRGIVGEIVLKVAKDKPGGIRGQAAGWTGSKTRMAEAARVTVDGTINGRISLTVMPPEDNTNEAGDWLPTGIMEKVSNALQLGVPLSFGKIKEQVAGKDDYLRAAVRALAEGGYIKVAPGGPGKPTIHTFIRQYRQTDKSSSAEGGTGSQAFTHPNDRPHPVPYREGDGGQGSDPVPGQGGTGLGQGLGTTTSAGPGWPFGAPEEVAS